jgi:hypothetical protein
MPAASSLQRLATLRTARAAHTAISLATGQVVIAGGMAGGDVSLASDERFDPARNALEQLLPLAEARSGHFATLLRDSRVLVAGSFDGNYLTSGGVFEPSTGRFRPAGSLTDRLGGSLASATCSAGNGSRVAGREPKVVCHWSGACPE